METEFVVDVMVGSFDKIGTELTKIEGVETADTVYCDP